MAKSKQPAIKSFTRVLGTYREMVERGEIAEVKTIERVAKFYGKRGQPLKRKLRSKKAQEEFAAAVKEYNKRFGTGGAARLKRESEKQQEKVRLQLKTRNKFTKKAKEETRKRYNAAQAFASSSLQELRDRLNIGSDVVQYLAIEKGYTSKQISKYLNKIESDYKMLTPTARKLADTDVLNKAIKTLVEDYGESTPDALAAFIIGESLQDENGAPRGLDALDAYEVFKNERESGERRIDFNSFTVDDFMRELTEYDDWGEDNLNEILDDVESKQNEKKGRKRK